jgi:biotin transporter BioY
MNSRVLPASLGGLACAICCAVPVLTAVGVLGGGAVAAAVEGWLDATAAVLVVVAVVLLALPVWRRRRSGCGADCGPTADCSCAVSKSVH